MRGTARSRRIRGALAAPAALLAAALGAGCAVSGPIDEARAAYEAGRPDEALERLADEDGVAERDRLVALLEAGWIAHAAGRIETSVAVLDRADDLIESLDALFVAEQSATLLINDRVARYRGEYAERLWIRTVQMMNRLLLGDLEGAAVEARRAVRTYETHGAPLDGDVATRVLAARTLEAVGELDGAAIEYARAFERAGGSIGTAAFALGAADRTGRADEARRYRTALEGVPGAGEGVVSGGSLLLAVADGRIPPKRAGDLFIRPDLRISFPHYAGGGPIAPGIVVEVDGARMPAPAVATRLGAVAEASLGARAKRVAAKQAVRAAAKQGIGHAAHREDPLLGVLADIVLVLLEEADTRGWRTLPGTLSLLEVPLAPGTHDVTVTLDGYGPSRRLRLDGLEVRAGAPTWVELLDGPRGLERVVARGEADDAGADGAALAAGPGRRPGAPGRPAGAPRYSSSSR